MKKTILAILLLMLIQSVHGLTITEVLFDPLGSESDIEFIELYNDGLEAADISGYVISTSSSARDATIPQSTILQEGYYYLIADIGYNANRNSSWPESDYEEEMTFLNSDGYARLLAPNNQTVSEISWNATAGGDISINRDPGNDETYFSPASPTNSKSKVSSGSITLNVELVDSGIEIQNVTITDEDQYTPGIQVYPQPGKTRHIPLTIVVSDSAGYQDITSIEVDFNTDSAAFESYSYNTATTKTFDASIDIPFVMPSGYYNLTITAISPAKTVYHSIEIFVPLINAFVIDSKEISFRASTGKEVTIYGDSDISTAEKPTIRNIGNSEITLSVSSAGLKNAGSTLPSKFLYASLCPGTCELKSLESTYVSLPVSSGTSVPLNIKLQTDAASSPGIYTGNLNIIGRT